MNINMKYRLVAILIVSISTTNCAFSTGGIFYPYARAFYENKKYKKGLRSINENRHDEMMARKNYMSCTTQNTSSTNILRSGTQTDFLIAKPLYSFYRTTGQFVSFSVLSELDDYREFYVILSTIKARSTPRIMIHIGANDGTECTLSKNGILMVRVKCKPEWRRNTYLPFWIWHRFGKIVVKAGYNAAEHCQRLIKWDDPAPFNAFYYGIRSSGYYDIPIILKNVDYENDWERY